MPETEAPAARPLAVELALPLAIAIALASAVGLLFPATYARETPGWAAQAIAQDWTDLLLAVPTLLVAAHHASRSAAPGLDALAGTMLFAAYSFLIYAFTIHFNALFLLYCAALGLSVYGVAGALVLVARRRAAVTSSLVARVTGWFLLVVAIIFALMWLAAILPAMIEGKTPAEISAAGLMTNPVHVIDLSIYLPGQAFVGLALVAGRPVGHRFAPVLLTFGTLMAVNLAVIMLVTSLRGLGGSLVMAGLFGGFALVNLALLVAFWRSSRPTAGAKSK